MHYFIIFIYAISIYNKWLRYDDEVKSLHFQKCVCNVINNDYNSHEQFRRMDWVLYLLNLCTLYSRRFYFKFFVHLKIATINL